MTQPLPTITVTGKRAEDSALIGGIWCNDDTADVFVDLPDGVYALLGPLPDGWTAEPVMPDCETDCAWCQTPVGTVVYRPCDTCDGGCGAQYHRHPQTASINDACFPCPAGCVEGMVPVGAGCMPGAYSGPGEGQ